MSKRVQFVFDERSFESIERLRAQGVEVPEFFYQLKEKSIMSEEKEKPAERLVVEVPLDKGVELQARHIDIQISHASRLKLSRMFYGLQRAGAQLDNGIPVKTAGHVVQWILENLKAEEQVVLQASVREK